MVASKAHIDPYLLQRQFEAFTTFVEKKSGMKFVSFMSNPYTEVHEGYKYGIYRAGRNALAFDTWRESDIGSGDIADAVIKAIELPENNLVPWHGRFGEKARPHHPLFEAKDKKHVLGKVEESLLKLYREEHGEQSFGELVEIFGKTYPLLAYLFFLKDRSRYLPIGPTVFDRAFEHLGAEFKTSHLCSWENYSDYIVLIGEVKTMLTEFLPSEVSLLDAHSFTWILGRQMERENALPDIHDYLSLPASEREAIGKARIGQGRFRQALIGYWKSCAVTGCLEVALLRASHIKPWALATLDERLSLYNGLLSSPALDACFDGGYITFDQVGRILISERVAISDATLLGIRADMCLRRIEPEHKKYLAFHREHIFKSQLP
jgi:hypothetical protein